MTSNQTGNSYADAAAQPIVDNEADAAVCSLRELLAADLLRATGRHGLKAALSALVYEPGFATVFAHRLAVALYTRRWPRAAKLLWRLNVLCSGCHIHLDAHIGPGLLLPHPVGIVIGSGTRIGADVTLYQNVTLGRARRTDLYPSIGADTVVYPGAVIAGDLTVGQRAVVGAGAVVIDDIADDATVAGNPARPIHARRATDAH